MIRKRRRMIAARGDRRHACGEMIPSDGCGAARALGKGSHVSPVFARQTLTLRFRHESLMHLPQRRKKRATEFATRREPAAPQNNTSRPPRLLAEIRNLLNGDCARERFFSSPRLMSFTLAQLNESASGQGILNCAIYLFQTD